MRERKLTNAISDKQTSKSCLTLYQTECGYPCDPPVGVMPMPLAPRKPMPVVSCQERTSCSVIGADDTTAEPPDGSEIIRNSGQQPSGPSPSTCAM
jgi:hypothetical protein